MKGHNIILALALFVAAAVAGYLFHGHSQSASARLTPANAAGSADAIGRMRPEFSLPDLSDQARSITEWDGNAMIVNFWATWCPPCRKEIPLLIEKQEQAAALGIVIVGIAIDNAEDVKRYAAEIGFNYPVLIGEQEAIDAAEGFGVDVVGLPLTVMTGRDGRVVELHAGEMSREDLEAAIAKLAQ